MGGLSGHQKGPKEQRWQARFLEALAKTGIVSDACMASGVGRSRAYAWREQSPHFAGQWAEAERAATDALEAEALRRAALGVRKPVFYKGEICGHVEEYSDTLLIFLLKARDPERFRERASIEHSGEVSIRQSDIDAAAESLEHKLSRPGQAGGAGADPGAAGS